MNRKNNRRQHALLIIGIILLSIFNHSIRDIPKYYKNMLYVSSINIVYYFIFRRHLIWEFVPIGIHWSLIRLAHVLIVSPFLTLMFLSTLPRDLFKKIIHLIKFVLISSIIEFVAYKKNLILFAHGWNIFWSGLIYLKMFVYSYLFGKRPLFTLALSLCSTIFFVYIFRAPLGTKHFSKYFEPAVDLYYHSFLERVFGNKPRRIFF